MNLKVEIPARVDLIGGWTDTFQPWLEQEVSAVLNASLDCFGLTIKVRPADEFCVEPSSHLTDCVLSHIGSKPNCSVIIENSIPLESGLGGSSILCCGLLAALYKFLDEPFNNFKLIEDTLEIERIMGSCGGYQDQIGALWPGLKLITTRPERPDDYRIQHIAGHDRGDVLENRSVLVDTGIRRKASSILFQLKSKVEAKDQEAWDMLALIRENAFRAWEFWEDENYDMLARAMGYSWQAVCRVVPDSYIPQVGQIEDIIGHNLWGGKLAGAGGGGFYFAVVKNQKKALARLQKQGLRVYKPKFDACLRIEKY